MNATELAATLRNLTSTQGQPLLTRVDVVIDAGTWTRRAGAAAIQQDTDGSCGIFLASPGSDAAAAVQQIIVDTLSADYVVSDAAGQIFVSDPYMELRSDAITQEETNTGRSY